MREVFGNYRFVSLVLTAWIVSSSVATAQQCVGDCDANGSVSVSELIRCVRIALDQADVETCPECDPNGDGSVRIPELVTAVSHALCACETCPTPVPTRTPTNTRTPLPATASPLPPTATPRPPSTPTSPPTACDFNGAWDGESTTVADTCDDDFDTDKFTITLSHDRRGILTGPEGFEGSLDTTGGQCCLNFTFIEPDEGGISCNAGRICQTADGREFLGSINWIFFESADSSCSDTDFECAGTESLTADRR